MDLLNNGRVHMAICQEEGELFAPGSKVEMRLYCPLSLSELDILTLTPLELI